MGHFEYGSDKNSIKVIETVVFVAEEYADLKWHSRGIWGICRILFPAISIQ